AVTGELHAGDTSGQSALKSPGLLRKHYSPKAKLEIWSWNDETTLRAKNGIAGVPVGKLHIIAQPNIPRGPGFGGVLVIPHDEVAFARAIYAALHECDQAGAELIVVEALPENYEWRAIADRLLRAAG